MTAAIATTRHGACPRCSTDTAIVWHDNCPLAGRERAVPCRNADGFEVLRGIHTTFADDRLCDRCRARESTAAAPSWTTRGSAGLGSPHPT